MALERGGAGDRRMGRVPNPTLRRYVCAVPHLATFGTSGSDIELDVQFRGKLFRTENIMGQP
eukprot:6173340-Pleurochrysis_carterae.AAC.1